MDLTRLFSVNWKLIEKNDTVVMEIINSNVFFYWEI